MDQYAAFGEYAVAKRAGLEYHTVAKAKWQGKGQARADWRGYAHPDIRGGWFIGMPDDDFQTEAHFHKRPILDAATRSVEYLAEHGAPIAPTQKHYSVSTMPDHIEGVLALDTEGQGRVLRASAAWVDESGIHACSLPWNEPARRWFARACQQATEVVMWHAKHDVDLLAQDNVYVDSGSVHDAMDAHQILHPGFKRGLGHAAPLYGCFQMWKHWAQNDPEEYSLYDAFVPLVMWLRMREVLEETHRWRLYLMERAFQGSIQFSAKPRWEGDENAVTKAAGLLEGGVQ